MSIETGSLVPRIYVGFRGVDFRGDEINLVRSPDALNMWKDYKEIDSIRTRPGMALMSSFDSTVYGIFFYKGAVIVHSGTKLYRIEGGTKTLLYDGVASEKSNAFVYEGVWYYMDGAHYLQYDGTSVGDVIGYIPTTSIGRRPMGGGSVYEDVNMISAYRKNTFLGDGASKDYLLDVYNIDSDYVPVITVNGLSVAGFTVNYSEGKISFSEAPSAPLTDGQDNVVIRFKKTVSTYRETILGCTLLQVFDKAYRESGNAQKNTAENSGVKYSISETTDGFTRNMDAPATDGERYAIATVATDDEIATIRSIGRKSINNFTSEDIQKTEAWARKFYRELGRKSPFFRAWFGDWRAYDKTKVAYVPIRDELISSSDVPRGKFNNEDTGWNIETTSRGIDETAAKKGKWSEEYHALTSIENLIQNAVLLDTVTVDKPSKKLGSGTVFVHHFYAPVISESGKGIAKIYVAENPESRKFYLLKIEKASADSTGSVNANPNSSADAMISIAEIFDFVKRNDKAYEKDSKNPIYFEPKEVNPAFLNENGTPKVFYHGTRTENGDFYVFDTSKAVKKGGLGLKALGKGNYFTSKKLDGSERYGSRIIEAFLHIENPYYFDGGQSILDQFTQDHGIKVESYDELQDIMRKMGYDGVIQRSKDGTPSIMVTFDSNQIKSATDNIGTFDGRDPDIRYSLSDPDIAPINYGDFNIYGDDVRFEAPIAEEAVESDRVENDNANIAPLPEGDSPVKENSIKTVADRIEAKIQALESEISNNQRFREQSIADYDSEISDLQSKYDSKKDKNTKIANNILRRIERLNRLKRSVDAEYAKRIGDLGARCDKMKEIVKNMKTAAQRKEKHDEYFEQMKNLVGDTSTWKDKRWGLWYKTNTLHRNLRDVVRDESGNRDIAKADAIYDELQGKYNRHEAQMHKESRKIKKPFADMKITSAEDTYIQMLGEFEYNPETTLEKADVDAFYEKHKDKIDVQKVKKAISEARTAYDSLFERLNNVLREQGMKEIPYRKGYFPHFTETKQGFLAKLFNWKTQDNEIPTDIAGMTEMFNPNRSWQSFNKKRQGDTTDYSFTKGFDTYVHGALDWIYHIEDIRKRRAFENYIRYIHSAEGVQERIDAIQADSSYDADEAQKQIDLVFKEAENPLPGFVNDLRAGTNRLANKKSSMDRGIEEATNRKIYSTMTNISNRLSGNMVAASISSALTNFIPITQSWGEVSPVYSAIAAGQTIKSIVKDDGMVEKSDFLTNRLRTEENLYKTTWDKISDKVGILFDAIDNFTSQVVWRSKYIQNIKNQMSENEAIKNADEFAANVMASRSRGDMPTIFDSKNPLVKIFTAFQLEVNNQYGYMFKDMPQNVKGKTKANTIGKLIGGYATMFLGSYAYNALYSMATGRDAAFDPIGIMQDLLQDVFGGDDDDEKAPIDIIMDFGDDILEEVPFIGNLAGGGRIPISSAIPYGDGIGKMITGTAKDFTDMEAFELLKKKVIENGIQGRLGEFCNHYVSEEMKNAKTAILASVGIPYEIFMMEYVKMDAADIRFSSELSKAQKKAILRASRMEPVKLTPEMMMKRGRGSTRRAPLGPKPETKKGIAFGTKFISTLLISLMMSVVVLDAIFEPTWTIVSACALKLVAVVVNGFGGYKFGYENVIIDTVNYVSDQADLLQQAMQYLESHPTAEELYPKT